MHFAQDATIYFKYVYTWSNTKVLSSVACFITVFRCLQIKDLVLLQDRFIQYIIRKTCYCYHSNGYGNSKCNKNNIRSKQYLYFGAILQHYLTKCTVLTQYLAKGSVCRLMRKVTFLLGSFSAMQQCSRKVCTQVVLAKKELRFERTTVSNS